MSWAFTMQNFQDWFTQQWAIIWGRKINPENTSWLMGPFGELNGIGENFIYQLVEKENLILKRNSNSKGLLHSFESLELTELKLRNLSEKIIDFYEHTSNYELKFRVKWNPFFKFFGWSVNQLFSQRINQLNIPTKNVEGESLTSEIIELICPKNGETIYTIWLRKFKSTEQIVYSGIYGICRIPSGEICVKAVFPLPKGNATIIMKPSVNQQNELVLDSSGKQFGDAGFYFLLNDAKGNFWAEFISSFTDKLIVSEKNGNLTAKQTLKLWNLKVAEFDYELKKKMTHS